MYSHYQNQASFYFSFSFAPLESFWFFFSAIKVVFSVFPSVLNILSWFKQNFKPKMFRWTLDLALIDHVSLALCLGHFCYYRWTQACTKPIWPFMTELCAESILFVTKFKSCREGLVYIKENNLASQTFGKYVKIFQAVNKAKAIKMWSLQRATQ